MSRVRDNLFSIKTETVTEDSGVQGADNVIISDTQPTNVANPSLWLDTSGNTNILKIFNGAEWITVSGAWG